MGALAQPVQTPFVAEGFPGRAGCSIPAQLLGIGLADLDTVVGRPQAGKVAVQERLIHVVAK